MRVAEQRAAAGREDFSGELRHVRLTPCNRRVGVLDWHADPLRPPPWPADLVAAKAAQQKRKAAEKAGGKEKKFKF